MYSVSTIKIRYVFFDLRWRVLFLSSPFELSCLFGFWQFICLYYCWDLWCILYYMATTSWIFAFASFQSEYSCSIQHTRFDTVPYRWNGRSAHRWFGSDRSRVRDCHIVSYSRLQKSGLDSLPLVHRGTGLGGLPALWVPFYLLHGDVETRYRGLRRCSLLYMLGSDDWSLINSLMQHAYTRWQASTGGEINLTRTLLTCTGTVFMSTWISTLDYWMSWS